jgi:type III pantothenate kinase
MLLALDIGNTYTTIGVYDHGWMFQHRLMTQRTGSQTEYERDLKHAIPVDIFRQLDAAVIGSVVPGITLTIRDAIASLIHCTPFLITPISYSYLRINTDTPQEVGVDLIANAVAAYTRHRKPCVIADFETALSFTTVSGQGAIEGVTLVPGLQTAMRALFNTTSQLPEVLIESPATVIGKNSHHAMQAGITRGYTGLVTHLMNEIEAELGVPCMRIGTGGLAYSLRGNHNLFDEFDSYLTLDGYRLLSQEIGVYRGPQA